MQRNARFHNRPRPRANLTRRGLTLIEVLIVIAILLAIGGIVVVNLIPRKEQADIDTQKLQLQQIDAAIEQFKLDMKRFPTEEEGIAALSSKESITNEDEAAHWRGPYLKTPITMDTWGSVLVYKIPGEKNADSYDLVSFGPDKQEGTADDISNATSQGNNGTSADSGDGFAPPPPAGNGGNSGGSRGGAGSGG